MLTVLDLFSGIGGFSLGLERTGGFKTIAFCEIDPFCRRVLAKHWPGVPCFEDITAAEFAPGFADVICGGFPCQDISIAGKRAGITGARSGLWRYMVDAIRVVRPRYAVVENVAALLGYGLGAVLGDLAAIGYDAEWHCIPASAVGAPHRRDRWWAVAYASGGGNGRDGFRAPRQGQPGAARADMARAPRLQQGRQEQRPERQRAGACGQSSDVAHAIGTGLEGRAGITVNIAEQLAALERSGAVSDADGEPSRRAAEPWRERRQWQSEPDVGRVAHGVPSRVDRLRSLGNAVVPQIPELIGRAILQAEGMST